MSEYLSATEYADYGLPTTTTAVQVRTASSLLNAYLGRPEGLLWAADAFGCPCYMPGLTPSLSLRAVTVVSEGTDVVVTLPYAVSPSLVGEAVVIDRASDALREACLVTAVDGKTITLDTVTFAHAAGASVETGLVLAERLSFGFSVGAAFLSRHPVVQVLGACARRDGRDRKGPRLSDQSQFRRSVYAESDFGSLPDFASSANPSLVTFIPPDGYRVDPATGEMTFLATTRSQELRVSYLAGYAPDCIPSAIKAATAALVAADNEYSDLPHGAKLLKAGDTTIERFDGSVLSDDILRQIAPFKATHGL